VGEEVTVSVGVVGAGAMGTLLGVHLSRSECDVAFLVKTSLDADRLKRRGVRLKGKTPWRARAEGRTRSELGGARDFVFLMVKSQDTLSGLKDCYGWVGPKTWVVSLQNGLSHLEVLREEVGGQHAVVGTTTCGATRLDVGEAQLAGLGETVVGGLTGPAQEGARQVAALLEKAGLSCVVSDSIEQDLWRKLLVNACINPVGAVLGLRNGRLAEGKDTRDLIRTLVKEAAPVAKRETGLKMTDRGLYRRVLSVCRRTADNRCSMLQDLERGRKTEVDSITGEMVRAGKRHGLSLPTHEAMLQLVRALERRET